MLIDKLQINPNNPRHIKDDKFKNLVNSIKSFPDMMAARPLVVNEVGVILGGNMRFRALKALKYTEIPDEWVKVVKGWTKEQEAEFLIKDNANYGEWDYEQLSNEWENSDLILWGVDLGGFSVSDADLSDESSLPTGDKSPFQQMTFTFADEQADIVKNALEVIKKTDEYKYCETMGNSNSNANALYLIVSQWKNKNN